MERFDVKKIIDGEEFYNLQEFYNTIRRTNIAMSWGINKPQNIYNKVLSFKVQGFILKGTVYLYLKNDLFNIVFVNRAGKIVEEVKGIYLEDVIDVIDRRVEKEGTKEEYKYAVNNTGILI